jgi:hypothetical protein
MSIIKDIFDAFDEVKRNLGAMQKAPDKIMNSGRAAGAEGRFFERPIDSVARRAKQSILYFPVIGSESLSAATLGIIAKATQVRAAEYVRLMIANMDPVEAGSVGKSAVIGAIRGATLKDALLSNEDAAAVSGLVRKNLSVLVEHTFLEDGLRPALLSEAEWVDREEWRSLGRKPGNWIDWDTWNKTHRGSRHGGGSRAQAPLSTAGVAGAIHQRSTPPSASQTREVDFEDLVSQLKTEYLNGTEMGKANAVARFRKLSQEYNFGADAIAHMRRNGLADLVDQADEPIRQQQAKKVTPTPEAEEKARRDKEMADIISVASRNTPQARNMAAQRIMTLMAQGNGNVNALRKDPNCSKLIDMIEKLPAGVIKDGSYDISAGSNKARVADAIDFNKLNQFQPVLLDLTIRYQAQNGDPMPITDSLALGVKGVAHPIPSMDLVTGLGTALQRDSLVLQFFRMTSGETSFLKDFVLNLKVAKMRASAKTTSGAKVLETLRRQSEWNERRSNVLIASIAKRGFVPPTTTLVVTADEAEKIKSLYGVDFTKPAAVRELMKSHNLMGFMIVDEAIGLVRVFEDGDDDFDRLPIDTLKAQGKETSIKDLMTILARS